MLYYNKKKSQKKHFIRIIVIIAIILFSSLSPQSTNISSKIVNFVSAPFAAATAFVTNAATNAVDAVIGTKQNRDLVNKLTIENQELQKKINDMNLVISQQDYLKEAYEFSQQHDAIEANVIITNNINYYNQFTIDKGSADNVKEGDIVLTSYTNDSDNVVGALVGKIVEVNRNSSIVSSILDEMYNISFVHAKSGITGIINDRSSGNIDGYMLEMTDVFIDDEIYTAGTSGRYPRGIYIGKVKQVSESADRLTKLVSIETPVDFSKLYEVYIVSGLEIGDQEWKNIK